MKYLKFETMFFPTILPNLWIDPFHQRVSFHQHVCEGRASKNANNF